jgi:3-dehydroshikimate dehydratase
MPGRQHRQRALFFHERKEQTVMPVLSAFSDEVTDDFAGQVGYLTAQQIRFVEIRFVNKKNVMDLSDAELRDVKRMLADNGIGVSAIGSPIGKVSIDAPFQPHLDKFKHAVELAEFFNAPFIRIFSYYPGSLQPIENDREEIVERMRKKVEILNGSAAVIVHENETGIYGSSAAACCDLAVSIDSPKFRLAYDPANFVWGGRITNNIDACWPLMKPYVSHVHIKDWKLGSQDVGSIPGEGDGQIGRLCEELALMKYDGFLTMEPHLKIGGKFGGETGPELFTRAIEATRALCADAGLPL